MKNILSQMTAEFSLYNARTDPPEVYKAFLEEDKAFIAGFSLSDPAVNYRLLSESDLDCHRCADEIRRCQESPYTNLLVIFYLEAGEYCCKYINGMASNLFPVTRKWCAALQRCAFSSAE